MVALVLCSLFLAEVKHYVTAVQADNHMQWLRQSGGFKLLDKGVLAVRYSMEHAGISRQEETPTISQLAHQLVELQAAVAHRHQDSCSEDSLQPADVRPRCRTTPAKQSQQQKPV